MFFIEEIEIKNCLFITHEFLKFEEKKYATIFNCSDSYILKCPVLLAVQSFFTTDFIQNVMKYNRKDKNKISFMRIKFHIVKDNETNVIDAMQISESPGYVKYYLNGQPFEDEVLIFIERCQIKASLFNIVTQEKNDSVCKWFSNNFLTRRDIENLYNLTDKFLTIANTNSIVQYQQITNLIQTYFLINKECYFLIKQTFALVANDIAKILTNITNKEYTVYFYIPLFGEFTDLHKTSWGCMDLRSVETKIIKKGWHDFCPLNQLEPALRNLFNISKTISLAKHLCQNIILMEDSSPLRQFQQDQLVKEALLQNERKWGQNDFVKRIVDVCNKMNITLVMNYSGLLLLPLKNANVIRCRDNEQSIMVCTSWSSICKSDFLELCIPSNLQNK